MTTMSFKGRRAMSLLSQRIGRPAARIYSKPLVTSRDRSFSTCRSCRIQQSDPRLSFIPFVTENDGRSIVNYDIFSRLLKDRIVILNGPIHDNLASSLIAQFLFLESEAPEKPISLYINSPGGEITAGLALYDTIQYIKSPVSTLCIGQAASAASLLLIAGAAGQRFALPNSSIMIHQPSGGYQGQASDIAIHARQILKIRTRINKIYQKHLTKEHSLEDIESMMDRDNYLSADEALDMGIVDQVLEHRE